MKKSVQIRLFMQLTQSGNTREMLGAELYWAKNEEKINFSDLDCRRL